MLMRNKIIGFKNLIKRLGFLGVIPFILWPLFFLLVILVVFRTEYDMAMTIVEDKTTIEAYDVAEDFKDYDFIMVDTAGHSLHNEELKQGVESFIRTLEDIMECENFLVLSATTKYRDLIEIADAYSEMVAYRLIFTKMDETGAKGNLYNVIR